MDISLIFSGIAIVISILTYINTPNKKDNFRSSLISNLKDLKYTILNIDPDNYTNQKTKEIDAQMINILREQINDLLFYQMREKDKKSSLNIIERKHLSKLQLEIDDHIGYITSNRNSNENKHFAVEAIKNLIKKL